MSRHHPTIVATGRASARANSSGTAPMPNGGQAPASSGLLRFTQSFASVAAILMAFWAAGILISRVLGAQLFFDEYHHIHYTWLISIGKLPHVDFWSQYPIPGYIMTLPLFSVLPETIYITFILRIVAVIFFAATAWVLVRHAMRVSGDWTWTLLVLCAAAMTEAVGELLTQFRTDAYAALTAISALALMLRAPSLPRAAGIGFLSVFSLLLMPKYEHMLFFGGIAYFLYATLRVPRGWRLLLVGVGGGVGALALTAAICASAGASLWTDLYWAHLFMQRFAVYCLKTNNPGDWMITWLLVPFFGRHWPFGLALLLGIFAWAIYAHRERTHVLWVGAGILSGLALFWGVGVFPFPQYLVPGVLVLLLFTPYIGVLPKTPWARCTITVGLVAMTAYSGIFGTGSAIQLVSGGSATSTFQVRQQLLGLVPPGERVVGFNYSHPVFREDLTFVTWDEVWGMPRGFTHVLSDEPDILAKFSVANLTNALQQTPPATIAFDNNYPPGWNDALAAYLRQHSGTYQQSTLFGNPYYIRKDLLNRSNGTATTSTR